MPIHTYTNWNVRPSDAEEQIEPFRKYFFICEGANTETFYVTIAIEQEKCINQDIHNVKGVVSSNIASIIEGIIADRP